MVQLFGQHNPREVVLNLSCTLELPEAHWKIQMPESLALGLRELVFTLVF